MGKLLNILQNINKVFIGKEEVISKIMTGILCGGHLLIEDVPGVGKTTLAKVIAKTLGCSFSRIQFTPDLMPADIIGISVYDKGRDEFVYRPGPVMSQIVLADEINRTSPRTQSSLLEAMEEGQVSVDGVTYKLPDPFIVIATQNPVEFEGTYPLPEAQLDRFMLRITIGYPGSEDERRILRLPAGKNLLQSVEAVITPEELLQLQRQAREVHLAGSLESYIIELARASRNHADVLLGISPRGAKHLYLAAKGLAFIKGRDYVLPDDIKEMLAFVFAHRIILKPEALLKGITALDIIAEIAERTPVPVMVDGR
ncbi:MAG: MoxR family ATPase [Bacillota bacterium]|jgi:MoxR-like ATPase|nr:MoxR family ATPase [Bacillota bacterium]HHU29995.1 MoxR family ATPase [Bacillota bacterium]